MPKRNPSEPRADGEATVRLNSTRVEPGPLPPRYRHAERIARGGMSEVYRATDAELGRTVAVKLLDGGYAGDPELRRRFRREALAAARLSDEPHTVTIYDVGEWLGRPFIVMEHLPGGSLEDLLRREGAQPSAAALRRLGDAATALDHAHDEGVVHRDVKPANLLLDRQGNVRVADFGIATAIGLASLTQTGTVLGTAGYLAPEQAEGKQATAAADRYALGVVAFELLTGERPFRRDSFTAEAAAHVNAPVPRASTRRRGLPRLLDPVFERALAKEPSARFATCRELVAALHAAYDAVGTTTLIAAPAPSPARRRRLPVMLGLAALLALAGGLLAAGLSGGRGRAVAQAAPWTVTRPATTRTVTVTAPAPTGGVALDRQAQALVQAGEFQSALPLLQQAVQQLTGSGTTGEADADYDLAYNLAQLGSCDGALPLLDRAQAIEGSQPRIDQLRAACTGPPGHRPGHGGGHGKDKGSR